MPISVNKRLGDVDQLIQIVPGIKLIEGKLGRNYFKLFHNRLNLCETLHLISKVGQVFSKFQVAI